MQSPLRPNLLEMSWLDLGKTSSISSLALGSLTLAPLPETTFSCVCLPVGKVQESVCQKWQRGQCPGCASSQGFLKRNWQATAVFTTQGNIFKFSLQSTNNKHHSSGISWHTIRLMQLGYLACQTLYVLGPSRLLRQPCPSKSTGRQFCQIIAWCFNKDQLWLA